MVDFQLVGKGQVHVAIQEAVEELCRELWIARNAKRGDTELAYLVVKRPVEDLHAADQKLRHVVHEELVEMIVAHHHQGIRTGELEKPAQAVAHLEPRGNERRLLVNPDTRPTGE